MNNKIAHPKKGVVAVVIAIAVALLCAFGWYLTTDQDRIWDEVAEGLKLDTQ